MWEQAGTHRGGCCKEAVGGLGSQWILLGEQEAAPGSGRAQGLLSAKDTVERLMMNSSISFLV